jgi:hypothetical protein
MEISSAKTKSRFVIFFVPLRVYVADSAIHQHSDATTDPTDPEQINSMINKAKQEARQRPVKLSQLSSISGGRHSFGGGEKSQKKRKHK